MTEAFNSTYPELLRALAVLIEENELITPYTVNDWEVGIHSYDEEGPTQIAAWRRALGGMWDKGDQETTIVLTQNNVASLPGNPTVHLYIGKNACVRRVVGTEEVKVPAVEAKPETTKTVEIVEWDCSPILSAVAS